MATGAALLVTALQRAGVTVVFGLPGLHVRAALDPPPTTCPCWSRSGPPAWAAAQNGP